MKGEIERNSRGRVKEIERGSPGREGEREIEAERDRER